MITTTSIRSENPDKVLVNGIAKLSDNKLNNELGLVQPLLQQATVALSKEKLNEHCKLAAEKRLALIDYCLQKGIVSAKDIAMACSQYYGLDFIDLSKIEVEGLPEQVQLEVPGICVEVSNNSITIAISDPKHFRWIDQFKFQQQKQVIINIAEHNQLIYLLNRLQSRYCYHHLKHSHNETNIISLVSQILDDAIISKASDIHIEPLKKNIRVRSRIDGKLQWVLEYKLDLHDAVVSRIKLLSELDIAEKRLPQDGHFHHQTKFSDARDCRVSTCPTIYGEKIVIRLLSPTENLIGIADLGFNPSQSSIVLSQLKKTQGFILVTGPTGSGKTVTLYAILNYLNKMDRNIVSIEDPVEIELAGINQTSINSKAGLTFPRILKSFLRQDPDIIMLGELRDLETAEIALQAALTGHLVLTTLHANSTQETIDRLIQLGLNKAQCRSAINLVIAQRLTRNLCGHCKIALNSDEKNIIQKKFPSLKDDLQIHSKHLFKAKGCHLCHQGFKGRSAVFELLSSNQKLDTKLNSTVNSGQESLQTAALNQFYQGSTSFSEINAFL